MLLLGPNIHVAKDVTMTQNGTGGCHWAISVHLIDVCLLHRIGAPREQGSQMRSVPWSTSSGSQEAFGEPWFGTLVCGAKHPSSHECTWQWDLRACGQTEAKASLPGLSPSLLVDSGQAALPQASTFLSVKWG